MGKAKRNSDQSPPTALLKPLLEPLGALQRLVEHFEQRGVIIGGVAASLIGQPRLTADLDAVILASIEDIPKLIDLAGKEGITIRIADAEAFARKNRVLLMQHAASGINIDISLGILPFEAEMVARGQEVTLSGLTVRLPTPEDLIIMKAIAHRPKDMGDIQAIAANHPDIDQERIRFWVEQFGEALDLPDLWEKISRLL